MVSAKPLCPALGDPVPVQVDDYVRCEPVEATGSISPCNLLKGDGGSCSLPDLKSVKIDDEGFEFELNNPETLPDFSLNGLNEATSTCTLTENGIDCDMPGLIDPIQKKPMLESDFDEQENPDQGVVISLSGMDDAIHCDDYGCVVMIGIPGKLGSWERKLSHNESVAVTKDGQAVFGITNVPGKFNKFEIKGSAYCTSIGIAKTLLCDVSRPMEVRTSNARKNKRRYQ
jgi:hypothetical protein